MLFPVGVARYLRSLHQQDFADKKHPEGIVTADNIRVDRGEELGERLTMLDAPIKRKAWGFFYKARWACSAS